MNGKNTRIIKNRGSLTLEACIGLVTFIFAFIALLSICKFVRAQAIMQHAVNQVAKEVSQYSYITNKLGLKRDKSLSNKTKEETDKMINETINFMTVLQSSSENVSATIKDIKEDPIVTEGDLYYNALMTYSKYKNAQDVIKDSYDATKEATSTLATEAENYLKDPIGLFKGFIAIGMDEVADYAISKYVAAPLSRLLIQKYLPSSSLTPDEYLKSLGIKDGLKGLNFELSTIHKDGKTINITLIYYMELDVPLIPNRTMCYTVNASTISWGSDITKTVLSSLKSTENSKEKYINIWDFGGERTTNEFINMIQGKTGYLTVRTPASLDYYDNTTNEFTYVHSMNTEMKSYTKEDGSLNLSQIKSKVKYYSNIAIEAADKAKNITMTDDTSYDNISKRDKKFKVIIVVQKSAQTSSADLERIKQEILKELKEANLEIEFYYSDGKVKVDD